MNEMFLARFIARAFGLFLLVNSVAKLPNVIMTLVAGKYSSFVEVFFAGALPFFIPPIVGLLIFWHPDGVIRMPRDAAKPGESYSQLNIEVVAISMLGLYWLVLGVIDTIYQFSWGLMTKESTGRFFNTYDAVADTVSALVELMVGGLLVYYAPLVRAKLLALRRGSLN